MPLIRFETSFKFADQGRKQEIAKTLSQIAAHETGKPEQYVMVSVHDDVTMLMGGTPDPCALVTVKAAGGLNRGINRSFAGKVCQLIQKELNIPQNRVYLTFEDLKPTHWAWNGETFG